MSSRPASSHPFRFGIHLWRLPTQGWRARAQRYEQAGFSTVTLTDHMVVPQWEPFTGLSAIAAVTERIGIGTLVLDAPLRDPVLTAKSAATLELLSDGRLELGIGAGYVSANFAAVGREFEPAATRLARLDEWVTLVRRLWTEPSTTMHGRFYQVADSPMVASEPVRPRLLVGGGGKHLLGLAGRMADTASLIPRQTSGEWSVTDSLPDSTLEHMIEKSAWVHEAASAVGRDHQAIELNTMVSRVIVGDDPEAAIAAEATAAGLTRADGRLHPLPVRHGKRGPRPPRAVAPANRDLLLLPLRPRRRADRLSGRACGRTAGRPRMGGLEPLTG